jgi:hypothetical protein
LAQTPGENWKRTPTDPNVKVDRAARFHASCAGRTKLQNTLPPLRSNDLFGDVIKQHIDNQ